MGFFYGRAGVLSETKNIPWGNAGVRVSVDSLLSIIRTWRINPDLVLFAKELVQNVPSKDYYGEVWTIQDWIKRNIRFTRDPVGGELLQDPEVTLKIANGDCDDHVILLNSLVNAIGIPTRVVLIASTSAAPNQYNHIFTEAWLPRPDNGQYAWIPVETTPVRQGEWFEMGRLPQGYRYERHGV